MGRDWSRFDGWDEMAEMYIREAHQLKDRSETALAESKFCAAYEVLARNYLGPIKGHCVGRLLGSGADAEDVAQEVFEGVWKSLPQFDGRASIRTWLFTIAHHKCADALRKMGRTVTLEDDNQNGETEPLPFSRTEGGQPELRDWLNRGLAKLSHEDRDVLLMSFVTELEPQEIAQQLGMTPGGVRTRRKRALDRLREVIGYER